MRLPAPLPHPVWTLLICGPCFCNYHSEGTIKGKVMWRWRWAKKSIMFHKNNITNHPDRKKRHYRKAHKCKQHVSFSCAFMTCFLSFRLVCLRPESSLVVCPNHSGESYSWKIIRGPYTMDNESTSDYQSHNFWKGISRQSPEGRRLLPSVLWATRFFPGEKWRLKARAVLRMAFLPLPLHSHWTTKRLFPDYLSWGFETTTFQLYYFPTWLSQILWCSIWKKNMEPNHYVMLFKEKQLISLFKKKAKIGCRADAVVGILQ